MNKELVENWIDALRSEKYNQGYGYLKTKDGYCCLGVLCKVAGRELVYTPGRDDYVNYQWIFNLFNETNGSDMRMKLMNMNDSRKHSFKEIADYIETNMEKLI